MAHHYRSRYVALFVRPAIPPPPSPGLSPRRHALHAFSVFFFFKRTGNRRRIFRTLSLCPYTSIVRTPKRRLRTTRGKALAVEKIHRVLNPPPDSHVLSNVSSAYENETSGARRRHDDDDDTVRTCPRGHHVLLPRERCRDGSETSNRVRNGRGRDDEGKSPELGE